MEGSVDTQSSNLSSIVRAELLLFVQTKEIERELNVQTGDNHGWN